MSQPTPPVHEQVLARQTHLAQQRALGMADYPNQVPGRLSAAQVLREAESADAEVQAPTVVVAGRVTALRPMGKTVFADLTDESGTLQLSFDRAYHQQHHGEALRTLDTGDLISAEGEVFRTRTGQWTLRAWRWTPLAKSLRPLPGLHYGLRDSETRARERELDLLLSAETRARFRTRSAVIAALRAELARRDFMEVEGPTLQLTAGGAEARPFTTRHNALGHDFQLRISLELSLKRLLVGGFERIFEIGRVYRNEGVDRTHNPEFTMLELYWAYQDYQAVATLTEDLIRAAARVCGGEELLRDGQGALNFAAPFARIDFVGSLHSRTGVDPLEPGALRAWGAEHRPGAWDDLPEHTLLDRAFGDLIEPTLVQPTFVFDHPLSLSPLARAHPTRPGLSERFELYCGGMEIANAYSELNDPAEQRARFDEQARRREAGDAEAHVQDEAFLRALERGMPPAGGLGIGIDRLVMLLTGQRHLREVLLFPLLRPEGGSANPDASPDTSSNTSPEPA